MLLVHEFYIGTAAVWVITSPIENWKIMIDGTVISDSIK
jgi:hypothetical protein